MNTVVTVRRLTQYDLYDYFELRLQALQDYPNGFMSSYEDEKAAGPAHFETVLMATGPENVIFGAFDGRDIVGALGLYQGRQTKAKHKCYIWGLFVSNFYRNRGIGKMLMALALDHAKNEMKGRVVQITVETKNDVAIKLYQSFGFKTWGTEPRAIQFEDQFMDEFHMALLWNDPP